MNDLQPLLQAVLDGALRPTTPELPQAALDHAILTAQTALRTILPPAYTEFLVLTHGAALSTTDGAVRLLSISELASLLRTSAPMRLRSAGGAEALVIGECGASLIALRLDATAVQPLLVSIARPTGFSLPAAPAALPSGHSPSLPDLVSPFLDYLERSWSDDNSWTHVGWGF
jgi:hypothetical protein